MRSPIILFLILLILLSACRSDDSPLVEAPGEQATETPEAQAESVAPTVETRATSTATDRPPTATTTSSPEPSATASATASPTVEPTPVSTPSSSDLVAAQIAVSSPPVRDDVRLAQAFRGLQLLDVEATNEPAEPRSIGARETFQVINVQANTVDPIEAELGYISDHAYFWFDTGPGSFLPSEQDLEETGMAFDLVYEGVVAAFGQERNPGIDGDSRLHVVNASPVALCGVTVDNANSCGLAGMVASKDRLPAEVDPRSNEREMFVMNVTRFGTPFYISVLAHEFRHMIEENYDLADTSWEKEGSATLAPELLGLDGGGTIRANLFLQNPDQQLNSWTDGPTSTYYGMGYLLNLYLHGQLGSELYRSFATHPFPGLRAVDGLAAEQGLELGGETIWLDWLAALALIGEDEIPANYRFDSEGLEPVARTDLSGAPPVLNQTVDQFAADFFELPLGTVNVSFEGSETADLLAAEAPSGERLWYALRGNYSNPRLTGSFDLSDVDEATLEYSAYVDIEQGYDFAYVSVSTDGGQTWQPLMGDGMQGQSEADNPAGSAYSERFYTGRARDWVTESVDLSPFAGQEILLRFEYVTDPVLTFGGFAVDDIAIPEIGFADDAESDSGAWTAEGFVRATSTLPQRWHLQLVTFDGDTPQVEHLALEDGRQLSMTVDGGRNKRPILIIAASAPDTLEGASYRIGVEPQS